MEWDLGSVSVFLTMMDADRNGQQMVRRITGAYPCVGKGDIGVKGLDFNSSSGSISVTVVGAPFYCFSISSKSQKEGIS